ncbi:hypothetical protein LX64_04333 [Chitinophaga skermanii]|uniref:Uncharacterized protein n=1 Tax=Chitinophaga skermanii TaxID=331697 RepID=A0A327Q668_9BACT|nr:hypothetical protein [Chitinophaga skermanii]RAI99780.1 hypothetical protein LX64_04333 [Chitinophaga skermanii]
MSNIHPQESNSESIQDNGIPTFENPIEETVTHAVDMPVENQLPPTQQEEGTFHVSNVANTRAEDTYHSINTAESRPVTINTDKTATHEITEQVILTTEVENTAGNSAPETPLKPVTSGDSISKEEPVSNKDGAPNTVNQPPKSSLKSRILQYAWMMIPTMVIIILVTVLYSTTTNKPLGLPKTILTEEWKDFYNGQNGLHVSLPYNLQKAELEEDMKELKKLARTVRTFKGGNEDYCSVDYNYIYFNRGTKVNIKDAKDGAINALKKKSDLHDITFQGEAKTINMIPSYLVRGSYDYMHVKKINFMFLVSGKNEQMWQVMVFWQAQDDIGKQVAERIINSAKF